VHLKADLQKYCKTLFCDKTFLTSGGTRNFHLQGAVALGQKFPSGVGATLQFADIGYCLQILAAETISKIFAQRYAD